MIDIEEETIVRLLEDAIKGCFENKRFGTESEDRSIIVNLTLGNVSNRFTLNERQNIAFVIAGSHLLDAFRRALRGDSPGKPLRMHIAGEGGTGKSRVVEALRFLCKYWVKPNAVVTVAPTGIAAVLIKG